MNFEENDKEISPSLITNKAFSDNTRIAFLSENAFNPNLQSTMDKKYLGPQLLFLYKVYEKMINKLGVSVKKLG